MKLHSIQQNPGEIDGLTMVFHVLQSEIERMDGALLDSIKDIAAAALAEKFLKERGLEALASIPTAAVVNLAVAKVAEKLSQENTKP